MREGGRFARFCLCFGFASSSSSCRLLLLALLTCSRILSDPTIALYDVPLQSRPSVAKYSLPPPPPSKTFLLRRIASSFFGSYLIVENTAHGYDSLDAKNTRLSRREEEEEEGVEASVDAYMIFFSHCFMSTPCV